MKINRILIIVIIIIFIGVGVYFYAHFSSKENSSTKITVALDWTPNTNHTGLYVAKDKGYYSDLGLDVKIVQPGDGTAEQLVASGDAQFGISSEEQLLVARNKGLPVIGIYAITGHNTSGFISKKDKNIKRPKDFEGKTYCGEGSQIEEELVKLAVKKDGGDPNKVTIQDSGGSIYNSDKNCDFFWIFKGWEGVDADLKGEDYNYISLQGLGIDWYTPIIITNENYMDKNKKTVQKFIDGTKKGYKYAIKYPDLSADILLKAAPELDSDLVHASQKDLSEWYKETGVKLGYFQPAVFDSFAKYLVQQGLLEKDFKIEEAYTNEFIK